MSNDDEYVSYSESDVEILARDMVGAYESDDELWLGVEGFAKFALARGWRKMHGWKATDERTWEHDGDNCPACLRIMQEYQAAALMARDTVELLRQIKESPVVPEYFRTDAADLLKRGFAS